MRITLIMSFSLVLFFAACGPQAPVYRTDYQLIPPKTETGGMCANNCLLTRQTCEQSCAMQKQSCESNNSLKEQNARLQGELDYANYVKQRTSEGKLIKKDRNYFVNFSPDDCNQYTCKSQCENSFHICYSNCGGQVIPNTYCTANCNQPQQMPAPVTNKPVIPR